VAAIERENVNTWLRPFGGRDMSSSVFPQPSPSIGSQIAVTVYLSPDEAMRPAFETQSADSPLSASSKTIDYSSTGGGRGCVG
jgi:hypothetical protein